MNKLRRIQDPRWQAIQPNQVKTPKQQSHQLWLAGHLGREKYLSTTLLPRPKAIFRCISQRTNKKFFPIWHPHNSYWNSVFTPIAKIQKWLHNLSQREDATCLRNWHFREGSYPKVKKIFHIMTRKRNRRSLGHNCGWTKLIRKLFFLKNSES